MNYEDSSKQTGSITDQVAQNPSSNTGSTASDHDLHKQGASAQDFKATPGPAIPSELPPKASKEELKARAEELNK